VTGLLITNVRIVTPDSVIERGALRVRGGRIVSLAPGRPPHAAGRERAEEEEVDGQGRLLLPGFIDVHNDGIEQEMEPRPGAVFPLSVALASLESQLVAHGVTTIFHSFSFMDGREGTLHPDSLDPAIRELIRIRRRGAIRHLVHARYEMVETHHAERFDRLIDDGLLNLVSFMDHTPGQGQYRDRAHLVTYYVRKYGTAPSEVETILRERQKRASDPSIPVTLERLAARVRRAGLPIASHDDDTAEKIRRMQALGASISEFPVTLHAAAEAARRGMHVAVGAPNVLRGGSTTDNLNALDAVEAGSAGILCSDYFAPALLPAVFKVAGEGRAGLVDAVRMASTNPAVAVGLGGEIGAIEPGRRADLILVSVASGLPTVVGAWVDGRRVFERHDGGREPLGEVWARMPREEEVNAP